jgi:hypothetical protein
MQHVLFIILDTRQNREKRTKYCSVVWCWCNGGPALRYLRISSQVYSIVWCLGGYVVSPLFTCSCKPVQFFHQSWF